MNCQKIKYAIEKTFNALYRHKIFFIIIMVPAAMALWFITLPLLALYLFARQKNEQG